MAASAALRSYAVLVVPIRAAVLRLREGGLVEWSLLLVIAAVCAGPGVSLVVTIVNGRRRR